MQRNWRGITRGSVTALALLALGVLALPSFAQPTATAISVPPKGILVGTAALVTPTVTFEDVHVLHRVVQNDQGRWVLRGSPFIPAEEGYYTVGYVYLQLSQSSRSWLSVGNYWTDVHASDLTNLSNFVRLYPGQEPIEIDGRYYIEGLCTATFTRTFTMVAAGGTDGPGGYGGYGFKAGPANLIVGAEGYYDLDGSAEVVISKLIQLAKK